MSILARGALRAVSRARQGQRQIQPRESRETTLEGGSSGPAIVPGRSAESYLIELVSGVDPDNVMPAKGTRLTAEEVGLLRAWIDQGLGLGTRRCISPGRRAKPDAAPAGVAGLEPSVDHPVDRFAAVVFRVARA